jgi:quercetin dioxygenase-like cupin family protein
MKFVHEDGITSSPTSPSQFTGGVWRSDILTGVSEGGMRAHRFLYLPGARSSWHIHEGEQAIFVLSGRGVVVRSGETAGTMVGPGDWVHVQPGELHWHGSVADDTLVHIAVTASGGTDWQGPVSDQDYRAALGEPRS